jgi:hypothetical protein
MIIVQKDERFTRRPTVSATGVLFITFHLYIQYWHNYLPIQLSNSTGKLTRTKTKVIANLLTMQ